MCIAVVVFIVTVGEVLLAYIIVSCIGDIAKVVAIKILEREAAYNLPAVALIVSIPHYAVCVLGEAFLTHEICTLDVAAASIAGCHAKLGEFVVEAELVIVAVAIGVVNGGGSGPVFVDVPRSREDVVVLPEVVSGLLPQAAVLHLITVSDIVAIGILGEIALVVIGEGLIEGVILTQPYVIHILIGLDARIDAVCAVHKAEVVVACGNTIPCLTSALEVAYVFIAYLEVVIQPGNTAIVTAATT